MRDVSTPDRLAPFRADLAALEAAGRTRRLILRAGVDFASNDYLGLAGHPRLAAAVQAALADGVPVGAAGSRLLRGNTDWQEAFEINAAAFFGAEAALGFGGGYQANVAVVSTLPQRGDLLLMDALSHASTRDGARLARAEVAEFQHNDAGHAEDVITDWRARGGNGAVWIAVESLYSMDGDRAPLDDLAQLADREGFLIVDEAHATGVWGPGGKGLSHALEGRENVITLHTLGKALGGSGALLCLPAVLRAALINRARPFIFATAPSPLMAVAGGAALDLLRDEPDLPQRLHDHIALFSQEMSARLPHLPMSGSQIVPLIVGEDAATMRLAAAVQAEGFDVRGIRPPTVPPGTARLRVSLTLNASAEDVVRLAATLERLWPDL
ncbi:8-amino-7-oxononanoate synthase [Paracoccus sanguinis]|uniref:8-amino-7-oxononanoate synthase n=1 Tax=Paracoccus sanguinis TaxID=1545044 RepID=A0A1H3C194_9RHOB|nr:8-amino-7-oxononanoate synthase [Paracoccus sanguinis]SDX47856.1 8-amino-7-oxononanoate synthase [Paracoccus sanguinis]